MADRYMTIRAPSGLSGDMLVAGLALLAGVSSEELGELAGRLGLEALQGCASLEARSVGGIAGHGLCLNLPREHAHRAWRDIRRIIESAAVLPEAARGLALKAFALLAEVEGRIHGVPAEQVCFHEVGALDSIADICLAACLFDRLGPVIPVCSPLPLADGVVRCAHGVLMSPAPAVQELLIGVPVYGVAPEGETVTPTAIALLKALDTRFGFWPAMTVERIARVYGSKTFTALPNGALFALGSAFPLPPRGQRHEPHVHIHGHTHEDEHD